MKAASVVDTACLSALLVPWRTPWSTAVKTHKPENFLLLQPHKNQKQSKRGKHVAYSDGGGREEAGRFGGRVDFIEVMYECAQYLLNYLNRTWRVP